MRNELEHLMSSLRPDHRNMAMLLDLLDAETELLADSGKPDYELVKRAYLVASHRRYSGQLREHMYWEKQELFKRADELQDDEKLLAALSQRTAIDDPLFGLKPEQKYRRLMARIQQRVVWNSQKYML